MYCSPLVYTRPAASLGASRLILWKKRWEPSCFFAVLVSLLIMLYSIRLPLQTFLRRVRSPRNWEGYHWLLIKLELISKKLSVVSWIINSDIACADHNSCNGVEGWLLSILNRLLQPGHSRLRISSMRILLLLTCCGCVPFSLPMLSRMKSLLKGLHILVQCLHLLQRTLSH